MTRKMNSTEGKLFQLAVRFHETLHQGNQAEGNRLRDEFLEAFTNAIRPEYRSKAEVVVWLKDLAVGTSWCPHFVLDRARDAGLFIGEPCCCGRDRVH